MSPHLRHPRLALVLAIASVFVAGCGSSSGGGTPPSSNADLTNLTVSAGQLTPAFDTNTLMYGVGPAGLLNVGTVTLTPTAADAGATIAVDGAAVASGSASPSIALPPGPTPVLVAVTAADGTNKTYTVVFRREPPTTQEAYFKASNTDPNDQFGFCIALSGDTLVVGADAEDSSAVGVNGNETDNSLLSAGAVYVFVRIGGVWSQQAYLKASNTDAGDRFGFSVAVDGDTIAVGSRLEDSNAMGVGGNEADDSLSGAGAVYVFTRTGGIWSQQAYVKASNTDAGDHFGFSVSLSGDTMVVGAPNENSNAFGVNGNDADNSLVGSGAAYVFVRTGGLWAQQAYLKASAPDASDQFGVSVSASGETVVVGANHEESNATGVNGNDADNSVNSAGAAYVFARAGGTWSQQAYLKASNPDADDDFGLRLSLSGDTVVVTSYSEDSAATGVNGDQTDNSATFAGAAYVFVRTGGAWSQQAYLKASNTEASDQFGSSVAISGNSILVAAWKEDGGTTGANGNDADNSAADAGAAYLFLRTGTTWTQSAYVKASNTDSGDQLGAGLFGLGVAVSGETYVMSAPSEDSDATGINGDQASNLATASGAAYAVR